MCQSTRTERKSMVIKRTDSIAMPRPGIWKGMYWGYTQNSVRISASCSYLAPYHGWGITVLGSLFVILVAING